MFVSRTIDPNHPPTNTHLVVKDYGNRPFFHNPLMNSTSPHMLDNAEKVMGCELHKEPIKSFAVLRIWLPGVVAQNLFLQFCLCIPIT